MGNALVNTAPGGNESASTKPGSLARSRSGPVTKAMGPHALINSQPLLASGLRNLRDIRGERI